VEQTVSRFLPNVLTQQALRELGVVRPELEAALQTQVSVALQRLYAQQHADGGWGWWPTGETNGYLTATRCTACLKRIGRICGGA
jgi:uncharacterized protein YfaS (alpha-2-macroglobulin family)